MAEEEITVTPAFIIAEHLARGYNNARGEISQGLREAGVKMRHISEIAGKECFMDKFIKRLPDKMTLFRGASLKEWENIKKRETPPGAWWTLQTTKALRYCCAFCPKDTNMGILIMKNAPRELIETIHPILYEVTIFQEDFFERKLPLSFMPLEEIAGLIEGRYNVKSWRDPLVKVPDIF